jgi:DNA-binding protein HU-beta
MNRAQLVELVAKQMGPNTSKAAADRAIGAVLHAIQSGLRRERKVTLVGFGTFLVKRRKAREGRNPRTQERIRISPTRTVTFKPGLEMKNRL